MEVAELTTLMLVPYDDVVKALTEEGVAEREVHELLDDATRYNRNGMPYPAGTYLHVVMLPPEISEVTARWKGKAVRTARAVLIGD